ncbi:hypothetical protein BX589_101117 [Paraburkholderia fungorum]|uniref:hypothetical protein n=1 Tax=Paraburkholderia fungorum TaxID=134537 RepID=UPI000D05B04B|nr:hypothetical protein [Paraburkholderia fungorum]PRZ56467.1 hypothetical protein BX589_101117 [Paraburkholderia fungorum]
MEQADKVHQQVWLAKSNLIAAIDQSDVEAVAEILSKGRTFRSLASIEMLRTEHGSIPLFAYAVERQRMAIAKVMLREGIVTGVVFRRALLCAARVGDAAMLAWLLTHVLEKLPNASLRAQTLTLALGAGPDRRRITACDAVLRPALAQAESDAKHNSPLGQRGGTREALGAPEAMESVRPILHLPRQRASRPEVAE